MISSDISQAKSQLRHLCRANRQALSIEQLQLAECLLAFQFMEHLASHNYRRVDSHGGEPLRGTGATRTGAGGGQTARLFPRVAVVPLDETARGGAPGGVDRRSGGGHPRVHPLSRVAFRSGAGGVAGGAGGEGRAGEVAGRTGMKAYRVSNER